MKQPFLFLLSVKAPSIALRTRTRNKKVSLTGSPRNAGNATCRARGFGALCHRLYKAVSKRNEMMYASYRRTFEHKTSPLFRGGFSPRRGHADVTIRSFKKSNRAISYQPPDFGSRQINGFRVTPQSRQGGMTHRRERREEDGNDPLLACRGMGILPMTFHGRDARATFGKR